MPAFAQDVQADADDASAGAEIAASDTPEGLQLPFSVAGGIDYTNAYFHRGYLQQSGGAVLQPYITAFKSYQASDSVIVRPYLTYFHSTGGWGNSADSPMGQYVSELMGGVFTTWNAWNVDLYYNLYFYPAMNFAHEGGGKVSYDLASLWRGTDPAAKFSLRPYTALYYGTLDQIGMGNGYFEAGVEPACRFDIAGRMIGVGFPNYLGMNVDGYYSNQNGSSEFLGFYASGVSASMPLSVKHGSCFLSGSVQYLHLIADNIERLNHGHPDMVIGKIGVGFKY